VLEMLVLPLSESRYCYFPLLERSIVEQMSHGQQVRVHIDCKQVLKQVRVMLLVRTQRIAFPVDIHHQMDYLLVKRMEHRHLTVPHYLN
jgi:hypothetical protein